MKKLEVTPNKDIYAVLTWFESYPEGKPGSGFEVLEHNCREEG